MVKRLEELNKEHCESCRLYPGHNELCEHSQREDGRVEADSPRCNNSEEWTRHINSWIMGRGYTCSVCGACYDAMFNYCPDCGQKHVAMGGGDRYPLGLPLDPKLNLYTKVKEFVKVCNPKKGPSGCPGCDADCTLNDICMDDDK